VKALNADQRKMLEIALVVLGCFGIYTYTMTLPVHRYCDWTGLEIVEPMGHEVIFTFANGTTRHYCCINVSLLAFDHIVETGEIDLLENIQVHCAICGMLMDWNDPMVVWIYQPEYLCPTTGTPTVVAVCGDMDNTELCESHFLDMYGGTIISCPYEWP